jgi:DNA-binding protein H-NS
MAAIDFELMSLDELWSLHEKLATALEARLNSEKAALEVRLKKLNRSASGERRASPNASGGERRPYPAVLPKYRNPANPAETWSGRGKQPRWLVALLQAGGQIAEFRIAPMPLRPSGNAKAANRKVRNG